MKTGRQASLATLLLSLWLCLYLKPCCGEITSEYAALHGVATDAVHAAHTEMHILAAEVELFVGVSQHTVQRRRDLVVAEAVWKAASVAHSKASVCMSLHKKASVSDDAALTPAQLKSKQQALFRWKSFDCDAVFSGEQSAPATPEPPAERAASVAPAKPEYQFVDDSADEL